MTNAELKAEVRATFARFERRLVGYLIATVTVILAAINCL